VADRDPVSLLLGVAGDAARFLGRHWPHLLLLPPMVVVVTLLHEGAHAAAVVHQGGVLDDFAILPSGGEWGHIRYHFEPGQAYSRPLVSLAPYALWTTIAALTWLASFTRRPVPFAVASTAFLWCYLIPLGDIANAAVPWALLGAGGNDLAHAFGPPSGASAAAVLGAGLWAAWATYGVQRRLYREAALGPAAFLALAGGALVAAFGLYGAMMARW
jgi:hypothetical protein